MGVSDDQFVPRAVAGDEAALTSLLECHGPQVRSALERSYRGRLSGRVDLDDVMQITYLEAFLRIRQFVPGGTNAFPGWLRRIGENNVRDAIRKSDAGGRARSSGPSPWWEDSCRALLEPVAGTATPSRAAGREEARHLLENALGQLPQDYERVLRLYDLEGRSGPDVARVIGRSHGAVKMLVARARDRLTEVLGSGSKFFSGGA
jgi:RNA polymerase sigma-70 factor (ECF subfamily)